MTTERDSKTAIGEAVWRLISHGGLETISMRRVAAEARVSTGRVQHHFRTRENLLAFSLRAAHERMGERIAARVQATDGSDRAVLHAILDELLGADPDTRATIRISTAFALREPTEAIQELLTDGDAEIVALATRVIAATDTETGADPHRAAEAVFAVVTGLGMQVALGTTTPDRAAEVLDDHLRVIGIPRKT